jgi:hypothetical protein
VTNVGLRIVCLANLALRILAPKSRWRKHIHVIQRSVLFWLLNCDTYSAVLKITMTDLPDEQRWSLQGQVIGQWAAELKSTWLAPRRHPEVHR